MKNHTPKFLATFSVFFLGSLFGALIAWQGPQLVEKAPAEATSEQSTEAVQDEDFNLDLFWNVLNRIDEKYYDHDHVTLEKQQYGAIKGLVNSLEDPYSVFMDPDETEAFQTSLTGELQGIGAELTVRDGRLVVVSPLKDSPAERAGLLPGDHVYLVDGEATAEMTLWEAVLNIRGEKGTEVTLTVIREDLDEPLDISIVRDEIEVPSIESKVVEHNGQKIAHIALYTFSDDSADEFQYAIRQAKLQGAESMILDLRGNGGGYLDVSVEILGEFFEEEVRGVVVKRRDQEDSILYTPGKGMIPDMPTVVLVNEGSASASEIVAGALQDYERATLIGAKTFGKGSVQELQPLPGSSSLRLTVAKWYTPADRSISEVGVTPDALIEMAPVDIDTENDSQLQAALDFLTQ